MERRQKCTVYVKTTIQSYRQTLNYRICGGNSPIEIALSDVCLQRCVLWPNGARQAAANWIRILFISACPTVFPYATFPDQQKVIKGVLHSHYCDRLRSCSFVRHVLAPGISRGSFDIESPNFTRTDIQTNPVYSHTRYDVTIYFRSEVIAKTKKYRLWRHRVEFPENGLS